MAEISGHGEMEVGNRRGGRKSKSQSESCKKGCKKGGRIYA
jgi:hypothetical protein